MPASKLDAPLSYVLERTLRNALATGDTLYGLESKTGVNRQGLSRYLSGERKGFDMRSVDKLLVHFALEVRPQKRSRRVRKEA